MEEGELMAIESVNPATGERIKTFDAISLKDAKKEVKKAHKAFLKWRMTSFSERKQLMLKAAEILKANKEQYAKLMTEEMGKPVREATSEVEKCAWACEFYAENAERFLKEEVVEGGKELCDIVLSLGLVASKTEWRRLVLGRAVENMETGEIIQDYNFKIEQGGIFKIGKKRFVKIAVRR